MWASNNYIGNIIPLTESVVLVIRKGEISLWSLFLMMTWLNVLFSKCLFIRYIIIFYPIAFSMAMIECDGDDKFIQKKERVFVVVSLQQSAHCATIFCFFRARRYTLSGVCTYSYLNSCLNLKLSTIKFMLSKFFWRAIRRRLAIPVFNIWNISANIKHMEMEVNGKLMYLCADIWCRSTVKEQWKALNAIWNT